MQVSGKISLMILLGLNVSLPPLYAQKAAPAAQETSCSIVQHGLGLKWSKAAAGLTLPARQHNARLPRAYQVYFTDAARLKSFMKAAGKQPTDIILPLPQETGCRTFTVIPSGTMSPQLAAKFPELVSLKGTSREEKNATLRLDYNGKELNAEITWNGIPYIIAPWKKGNRIYYLVYKKEDSGTEKKPFSER